MRFERLGIEEKRPGFVFFDVSFKKIHCLRFKKIIGIEKNTQLVDAFSTPTLRHVHAPLGDLFRLNATILESFL